MYLYLGTLNKTWKLQLEGWGAVKHNPAYITVPWNFFTDIFLKLHFIHTGKNVLLIAMPTWIFEVKNFSVTKWYRLVNSLTNNFNNFLELSPRWTSGRRLTARFSLLFQKCVVPLGLPSAMTSILSQLHELQHTDSYLFSCHYSFNIQYTLTTTKW